MIFKKVLYNKIKVNIFLTLVENINDNKINFKLDDEKNAKKKHENIYDFNTINFLNNENLGNITNINDINNESEDDSINEKANQLIDFPKNELIKNEDVYNDTIKLNY